MNIKNYFKMYLVNGNKTAFLELKEFIEIRVQSIVISYYSHIQAAFSEEVPFKKILRRSVLSGVKNSHSRVLVPCMKHFFCGNGMEKSS